MADEIEVTLINDADGETMARRMLPVEALPESFFADTTLHIGNADWSVVSAEPKTRNEYRTSGSLVLRLRKIEYMDPKKILFSLPTICDELPACEGAPVDGSELLLAEDDFRQVELVSRSQIALVEKEIEAVRAIFENERVGPGFRNLHVRREIGAPIAPPYPSFAELVSVSEGRVGSLCFRGAPKRVTHGFSIAEAKTPAVYGIHVEDELRVLGIVGFSDSFGGDLEAFAARHGLLLVDWCGCSMRVPGSATET